jgi:SAM-dependent methyltransferase
MPAVSDNRRKWAEHNWEHAGHKWSPGGNAAGTDMLWSRSIWPRIAPHLPAATILEIAPGFGRWTEYLLEHCERLIGVDLTPRCIEVCRERFPGWRASFEVNDGESLPMVASGSLDFTFSFDSLVHVEAPQIASYLAELARVLKPGAAAFLHHSNLNAYVGDRSEAPWWVSERHWRARSVSARSFREAARAAGLVCVSQELINWIGRDAVVDRYRIPAARIPLTDCLSIVMRPDGDAAAATRILCDRAFVDEWRQTLSLVPVYGRHPPEGSPAGAAAEPRRRLVVWKERAHKELASRAFPRFDPIAPSLRAGRCPDCGTVMTGIGGQTSSCARCRTEWSLR